MPGRTIYLSENPNEFHWAIPKGSGRAFETFIHKYLKKYVATQDGRVKVAPTRAVGDAGRDFEIHFSGEVELFGVKILQRAGIASDIVFVECKSTEHEKLDDEFIVDSSQHNDYESCAYVLVTNAVVTPYCQYRAQHEWERKHSTFHLVDRRKLADEVHRRQMAGDANRLGLKLPHQSELPIFDRTRLVVSCQTDSTPVEDKQVAHVYLAMTNYSSESMLSQIGIATDIRWWPEQSKYERVIAPGYVETIDLTADRQDLGGPASLDLTLTVNGRSQRIAVSSPKHKITFEPDFVGQSHGRIAQEIRLAAETATGFTLVSIQGEAGVGKTRTVKEALRPLKGGTLYPFVYNFSRNQGAPSFDDFCRTFDLGDELDRISDPATKLSEMLRLATTVDVGVLVLFEDLHHADEMMLKVFKQIALTPPLSAQPLILIVTGRDDHTFPNEEYYSFLQLLSNQSLDHVHCHLIPPLTDTDAEILIRSVVKNIPDPGVERVQKLGQNNPFIIVEVLQYLLDMRLAELLSRRTVGVLNPEEFAGRGGLPATVEELYDLRLASLKEAVHGQLANEFLIVASFFGFIIDPEVRRAFFDGEETGEESWELLCERRFVRDDPDASHPTFAHENLLHHMRRLARLPENAVQSSSQVLDRPGLAKRLRNFDLGEVLYLHKDYREAFQHFSCIWERIQKITNFSSEEIDKSFFSYLPALFHTAKAMDESKAALSKVALAHGYMGVHNFPLMIAENACSISNDMLREIYRKESEGLREKLAVRQLRAHALQNMGRTSEALREMLEIDASLSEAGQDWPELEFDLYDRLQSYYRRINHEAMVRFYGRQAGKSVARACDKKLRAAHLITQSVVHLFSGEREARRYAAEALEASKCVGITRFIMYNRLTELVVETLYSHQDRAILNTIYDEARTMLRDAAVNSFSDSIMRLELLLGTLALNCYEDPRERYDRARFYVNSGQANSIRFGHGLFDWALDNLAAVIALQDQTDEEVRPRFRSCFERLRKRGLTFLGAESGTYPNAFAISNIIRFYGQFHDGEGVDLIRCALSTYDNRFFDERKSLELVHKAVRGQAIFWPRKPRFQMIRYPPLNGYFTPVF